MKILTLTKMELKMIWNEFRLSLKTRQVIASYATAIVVMTLIFFSSYTFLFVVPEETRQYFFDTELFQRLYEELVIIFYAWTFLNVLQGLFPSNFAQMFNRSDLGLLFSSPIRPLELYISKYIKDALRRLTLLTISFLTGAPIIWYLNLQPLQIVTSFVVLAIFLEATYVLRYFTFFFTQRIVPHLRSWKTLLIIESLVLLSLYLASTENARIIRNIIFRLTPPAVAVQALFQCAANFPVWAPTSLLIAYFAALYLVFSLSSLIMGGNYYEKVVIAHETPWRLGLDFMRDRIPWRLGRHYGSFIVIALKDLLLHLREYGKIFLVGIVIGYGSLGIVIGFRPIFMKMIPSTYEIEAFLLFILPIVISLFLCHVSPSPHVFTEELGDLWVLKASPLSPRSIVYGKYFYGVIVSAILGLPIAALLILLLSSGARQWIMTLLTFHVLFMSNALGTMTSAHFSSASREKPTLPFSAYLAYLILVLFITELMTIMIFYINPFIVVIAIVSFSTALAVFICLKLAMKALTEREDLE